tara:strand:- start:249 stop:479 length:231 start_codon:yes stop_codon:yes gene_type:complete
MKFILILHLCSVVTGKCTESSITGVMFKDHYNCALAGYRLGYETFKRLEEDVYYGLDRINKEKIAIKFECKELPST